MKMGFRSPDGEVMMPWGDSDSEPYHMPVQLPARIFRACPIRPAKQDSMASGSDVPEAVASRPLPPADDSSTDPGAVASRPLLSAEELQQDKGTASTVISSTAASSTGSAPPAISRGGVGIGVGDTAPSAETNSALRERSPTSKRRDIAADHGRYIRVEDRDIAAGRSRSWVVPNIEERRLTS